jgi:hypothetical protein
VKGSQFKSAARSILSFFYEGLIWTGISFGMGAEAAAEMKSSTRLRAGSRNKPDDGPRDGSGESPDGPEGVRESPDQLPTPLSMAENAEWAQLVARLQ